LQKAVSQGAFAVVDMCDDAEIPDILHVQRSVFGMRKGSLFGWDWRDVNGDLED
jgi:hypothetical protein